MLRVCKKTRHSGSVRKPGFQGHPRGVTAFARGQRSPGTLTVAFQCLRGRQKAQSGVSCWRGPGPDHAGEHCQQRPLLLWWCHWSELSSAGTWPAGLQSAAGSVPELGLQSFGAAGFDSTHGNHKARA